MVITVDRAEAISTVTVTVKRLLALPGPFVRGEFTIRRFDRPARPQTLARSRERAA